MPIIPENGRCMTHDKAARALHSTAHFRDPHKGRSDRLGKALLVALFSGLAAAGIAVLSDSVPAFLPAWAVMFLLGYGAFIEREK